VLHKRGRGSLCPRWFLSAQSGSGVPADFDSIKFERLACQQSSSRDADSARRDQYRLLGVHSILVKLYYNLNLQQLQTAADIAVRARGEYLPGNPRGTIATADVYACRYGVAQDEIAFTGRTLNDLTLTIRLRRRIPWYTAASAIDLAHRTITVTATEQVRRDHPQNVSARITDLGTSVENGSIDFDPPKVGRNLFLRGDHFVRAAA
jgi:hypothetical protein